MNSKTLRCTLAAAALLSAGAVLADEAPGQGSTMGHNSSTMSNGKTAGTDTSTPKTMSNKKGRKTRHATTGNSDVNATPSAQPTAGSKTGANASGNSDVNATPGK